MAAVVASHRRVLMRGRMEGLLGRGEFPTSYRRRLAGKTASAEADDRLCSHDWSVVIRSFSCDKNRRSANLAPESQRSLERYPEGKEVSSYYNVIQAMKVPIPATTWRRRLDDMFGFLNEIRKSSTQQEICRHLLCYAERFGATNLLAGPIPPPRALRREQLSHVLLDAWPEEWSTRYFSKGYLGRDPTIQLVSRGNMPFLWSELDTLCNVAPSGRRIMDEAAEFNLREGLTLPFATTEGHAIGFSVAGKKLEPDSHDRLAFQFVAAYAFGCVAVLADGKRNTRPARLSPRQHDVLRWASEGLTVDEIADHLHISRNTADTHLRLVRERLGVTSTIHAVAEAFRLGLIA
ncbi:LuxR family transcriptional regulator [Mesorhizobium sp. M0025]|uniref:helix-turn-helix transcriptional regulator n=1 Tax=Mesorhizobium sp. M0025 TaxID=2956846 RepID=UPI00333BA6F6